MRSKHPLRTVDTTTRRMDDEQLKKTKTFPKTTPTTRQNSTCWSTPTPTKWGPSPTTWETIEPLQSFTTQIEQWRWVPRDQPPWTTLEDWVVDVINLRIRSPTTTTPTTPTNVLTQRPTTPPTRHKRLTAFLPHPLIPTPTPTWPWLNTTTTCNPIWAMATRLPVAAATPTTFVKSPTWETLKKKFQIVQWGKSKTST